jgi:hypothetical protein
MKEMRSFVKGLAVCGIALAMISTLSAQTVTQRSATVRKIKGDARYSVGGGDWKQLKVGDKVKAGMTIQTSKEKGSFVDLVTGEISSRPTAVQGAAAASGGSGFAPASEQNALRISENTILSIDKFTSMETGSGEPVTEVQLDLKAGKIFGSVKKMSAGSKYEVKIPNGVAGIRGTMFSISADGVVDVMVGSVVMAYVDPGSGAVSTQIVSGNQEYDARTGILSPLPNSARQVLDGIATVFRTYLPAVTPSGISTDHTLRYVSPTGGP